MYQFLQYKFLMDEAFGFKRCPYRSCRRSSKYGPVSSSKGKSIFRELSSTASPKKQEQAAFMAEMEKQLKEDHVPQGELNQRQLKYRFIETNNKTSTLSDLGNMGVMEAMFSSPKNDILPPLKMSFYNDTVTPAPAKAYYQGETIKMLPACTYQGPLGC